MDSATRDNMTDLEKCKKATVAVWRNSFGSASWAGTVQQQQQIGKVIRRDLLWRSNRLVFIGGDPGVFAAATL